MTDPTTTFYAILSDILIELGLTPPDIGTPYADCMDTLYEALYILRSMKNPIGKGRCCSHCDYFEIDYNGDGFCQYQSRDSLWGNICDAFKEKP